MAGLSTEESDTDAVVWLHPRRTDIRHRVVVVCEKVCTVIDAAGGWLFDHGLAGCEATALVAEHSDDRALRIVGARAIELHTPRASAVLRARPDTLVVAPDLFRHDERVHQAVVQAINHGLTNVMICGDSSVTAFNGLGASVQHGLTLAARAFKKEALAALGASSIPVGPVETFCAIDLRASRPEAVRRTESTKLTTHGRTA